MYEDDTGSVQDIDGTTAADTGDANLEPLRSGKKWDMSGSVHLTYSYYDGGTPYSSTYNASTGTPAPVSDYGAGNEAALDAAFDAWDETVDFTFSEVTENGGTQVGDLRVAYTDRSSGAAAFAYYPGDYAVNGDIYFETGIRISAGLALMTLVPMGLAVPALIILPRCMKLATPLASATHLIAVMTAQMAMMTSRLPMTPCAIRS